MGKIISIGIISMVVTLCICVITTIINILSVTKKDYRYDLDYGVIGIACIIVGLIDTIIFSSSLIATKSYKEPVSFTILSILILFGLLLVIMGMLSLNYKLAIRDECIENIGYTGKKKIINYSDIVLAKLDNRGKLSIYTNKSKKPVIKLDRRLDEIQNKLKKKLKEHKIEIEQAETVRFFYIKLSKGNKIFYTIMLVIFAVLDLIMLLSVIIELNPLTLIAIVVFSLLVYWMLSLINNYMLVVDECKRIEYKTFTGKIKRLSFSEVKYIVKVLDNETNQFMMYNIITNNGKKFGFSITESHINIHLFEQLIKNKHWRVIESPPN